MNGIERWLSNIFIFHLTLFEFVSVIMHFVVRKLYIFFFILVLEDTDTLDYNAHSRVQFIEEAFSLL